MKYKTVKGDIWDHAFKEHEKDEKEIFIVITTNGYVKKDGSAVMGRGLAKQCVEIYGPSTADWLGKHITLYGNMVHIWKDVNEFGLSFEPGLIFLPVKHHWREDADIKLIEKSLIKLNSLIKKLDDLRGSHIFFTYPGTGNGRLKVEQVKPLVDKYLNFENCTLVIQ